MALMSVDMGVMIIEERRLSSARPVAIQKSQSGFKINRKRRERELSVVKKRRDFYQYSWGRFH